MLPRAIGYSPARAAAAFARACGESFGTTGPPAYNETISGAGSPIRYTASSIKDCSRRGEIVLDPFAGSGTTLIAAEKTGRRARVIEFDPAYCDQIVRRFEQVTGKQATLAANGQSFETVTDERIETPPSLIPERV